MIYFVAHAECDRCEKRYEFQINTGMKPARGAKILKLQMADDGWEINDNATICPECMKGRAEPCPCCGKY